MTLNLSKLPGSRKFTTRGRRKSKNNRANVKDVDVEITFDPPWTKDLMSEEAKLELGML